MVCPRLWVISDLRKAQRKPLHVNNVIYDDDSHLFTPSFPNENAPNNGYK